MRRDPAEKAPITICVPGDGCIGTSVPESSFTRLAVALQQIDAENPEAVAAIEAERRAKGAPKTESEFVPYDELPIPITQVQPVYPAKAKPEQIEGGSFCMYWWASMAGSMK